MYRSFCVNVTRIPLPDLIVADQAPDSRVGFVVFGRTGRCLRAFPESGSILFRRENAGDEGFMHRCPLGRKPVNDRRILYIRRLPASLAHRDQYSCACKKMSVGHGIFAAP